MSDPRTIGELIAWLEVQGNISGSPGVDGLAEGYKDAASHLRRIAYGKECGHPNPPKHYAMVPCSVELNGCPGTTGGLIERVLGPDESTWETFDPGDGLPAIRSKDIAALFRTELAIPEEKP